MSKPVFEDWFKFSGRRNRQSYILASLAVVAIAIVLGFLLGLSVALGSTEPALGGLGILASGICFIALAVASYAIGAQRIRDFGYSGVFILAVLIPYIGPVFALALWFIPSDAGDNRYGPNCIK